MTETKKNRLIKEEFLRHLDSLVVDDKTKNFLLDNGKIILINTANKIQMGGVFKAHGKLFADISKNIDDIREHLKLINFSVENAKKIHTIIELD